MSMTGADEVYLIHFQHQVQRCTLEKRGGECPLTLEDAQNVFVDSNYIGFIMRPHKHTHKPNFGGVYDYKYQFHARPNHGIVDPVIVYVSPLEATLRAINEVIA